METYRKIMDLQEQGIPHPEIARALEVSEEWLRKVVESDSFATYKKLFGPQARS